MTRVVGGDIDKMSLEHGFEVINIDAFPEPYKTDMINLREVFYTHAWRRAQDTKVGHEILFAFVNDSEFNAFAGQFDGDVICINAGVLIRLRDHYQFMTDRIGDYFKLPNAILSNAVKWLYYRSMFWVFAHELGHIWNGHVDLVGESGIRLMQELRMVAETGINSVELQTLEMDADGYATANVMGTCRAFDPLGLVDVDGLIFPKFEKEFGPGSSRVALGSLAIHTVYKCFDELNDDNSVEIEALDHPPAPVRQFMSVGSAAVALERDLGWDTQRSISILTQGMLHADNVYCDLRNSSRLDQSDLNIITRKTNTFLKKYLACWHELRPKLDIIKRGGELPPVQNWPVE